MKAIMVSFIIFLCITVLGITELVITTNYMHSLNENTNKIEKAVQEENIQALGNELKIFSDKWLKMRFKLSLITEHKLLFDIDNALLQLENFSQTFDIAEAMLSVSELRASINCVTETTAFSFENII